MLHEPSSAFWAHPAINARKQMLPNKIERSFLISAGVFEVEKKMLANIPDILG